MPKLRVQIVEAPDWSSVCNWYARELTRRLQDDEDLAVTRGEKPDPTVDLNYWFGWYSKKDEPRPEPSAAWMTHLVPRYPFDVGNMLRRYVYLICESQATAQRVMMALGWPGDRIAIAYPGADEFLRKPPKPVTIGLTGNIYANGRKGEWTLVEAAWRGNLDGLLFEILGTGWDNVVAQLRAYGSIQLSYQPNCPVNDYPEKFAGWDYYLSLGMVEGGPQGVIQALHSGVKVISRPTGVAADFSQHCLIYNNTEELAKILTGLRQSFVDFTWDNFAAIHAKVFKRILRPEVGTSKPQILVPTLETVRKLT